MGTTANRGYTYPAASDPPQGNAQIQTLAENIDVDVAGLPILQAKKSIIAAAQSRTNAAYGKLGTADEVTGIVLPTDGWIVVGFQALWKCSVADAGRAAIFIGSDQYQARAGAANVAPVTMAAACGAAAGGNADKYRALATAGALGIVSDVDNASDSTSDVTTGQGVGIVAPVGSTALYHEIGGSVLSSNYRHSSNPKTVIFAAAGTYTISIQVKSASGSVTMKERKLWAYTVAFD